MARRFSLLTLLALFLFFTSSWAQEEAYDRILVKVNSGIITQYDLEEEMRPILASVRGRQMTQAERKQLADLRRQILERMVNDMLMKQEIAKYQIEVSDSVLDDEIRRMRDERGLSAEEFEETVRRDGLSMQEFRHKLRGIIEKQELLGYMVHSKVVVTDTEIQAEYEAKRDNYTLDKMVTLAIIMLPADVSAIEVKKRIEGGELTFSQAVERYSVGPGKDSGGVIGEVNWADLADDWRESIEGVKQGGVGQPLEVRGHTALLSPASIASDRLVPLEDVRDAIFERLMETKRDTIFDEYFEKLKQSSVIIYMD
ncbi:SurA N-terminal domain-containing protein [Pseudodesulfovibrio alkaliphilus]|uniref:SurA N-terminal domain-containing protein n=1 Tax=Pseudodesulfovibrio alkaliphilus TaxID=2661613 RepID=UPI00346288BD